LALGAALVGAGWGFGAWRMAAPLPERAEPVVVRLVQPNAPQHLKWRPELQQAFYDRQVAATRAPGAPRPDVTIWSETAVPFVLGYADGLLAEIAAAAAPEGVVALGIRRLETGPGGDAWFNSLAVLAPDGTPSAVYDKYRLVPFGEYIPLAGAIARLGLPQLDTLTLSGFTPGAGPRLMTIPGLPPFLPLVCYEAIFPQGMRAPEGRAEWIVQVTNDAWFGELSGPYQHLAQARARAIEQGLPLARAANTGVSAMIDPFGRIAASLPLGVAGHVDAVLPAPLPETIYAWSGDLPLILGVMGIFVLTVSNFRGSVSFPPRR
nr:apolipoprotein N-acyltransferase [Paracoccaceae bacterium]